MRARHSADVSPFLSSRVFLAAGCIHPLDVFSRETGLGVFALRVMDERSRSRWAWWSRSQGTVTHRARAVHARARERESMTHVLYTRAKGTIRASLFLSLFPLFFHVLRQTFVPQETRSRREEEEGEEG